MDSVMDFPVFEVSIMRCNYLYISMLMDARDANRDG